MTFPSLADAHAKWKLNFAEPLYGEHRSVATYLQVNFSSTFAIGSLCNLTKMFHQLWETQNMICRHTALTYYLSVTKETIET